MKDKSPKSTSARDIRRQQPSRQKFISRVSEPDSADLEQELDQALDNSEFEMFYQAKLDLRSRLPVGAEALIRWRNPRRGLVPPDEFIPAAARSGQLREITWSTLNMALQHAATWPTHFGLLTVSVNMSPALLDDGHLARRVEDAIAVWDIEPERLILEITESEVANNPTASIETIRALRAKGISVSIDDFGTGYSSLMQFKNIPATELKIDKSFVSNMLQNALDPIIVRNIVGLARAFEIEVVAEGVEDLETMEVLAGMGITYGQGYFISKPLPAAHFVQFINDMASATKATRDVKIDHKLAAYGLVSTECVRQAGAAPV